MLGDGRRAEKGRETARVADLKRQFDYKKRSLEPLLFQAVSDFCGIPLPANFIVSSFVHALSPKTFTVWALFIAPMSCLRYFCKALSMFTWIGVA